MSEVKNDLELLGILKKRFDDNMKRHNHISWKQVESCLIGNSNALFSLTQMELTGGEPDVVIFDKESTEIIFCDCSKETPKGRRSFCYDQEALLSRKKFPPKNSAINNAAEMGIIIMDETMYRKMQVIESFDLKTSSWILTPSTIRNKGGALFCDNRFDSTFTYHNGADSYYAARGYRGYIKVN